MKHDIAFLHTGEVHVETFGQLLVEIEPAITVRHLVNESLLDDARQQGLTAEVTQRIGDAMHNAASSGAKIVICTCSTIGGVAEALDRSTDFTAARIDRAMADEAVQWGQRILMAAAVESTLYPTRDLLDSSAQKHGRTPEIEMRHIQDAWQHFEAGDHTQYVQTIADQLAQIWHGYDLVVLAQASMADAAELCDSVEIPIFSSPRIGVQAAVAAWKKLHTPN